MDVYRFFAGVVFASAGFLTAAAAIADAPVPIASLTLDQRLSLPADTQVTIDGRTTTLGVLRAEHAARVTRFGHAAGLGRAAAEKLGSTSSLVSANPKPTASASSSILGKAGSPKISGTAPLAGPAIALLKSKDQDFDFWAQDYKSFCAAANASLCTYLPPNTTVQYAVFSSGLDADIVTDKDPLIGDPLCSQGGGKMNAQYECVYKYPEQQRLQFSPEGLVSFTGACSDSIFTFVNDPHGAGQIKFAAGSTGGQDVTMTTGSVASTCLVDIRVKPMTP